MNRMVVLENPGILPDYIGARWEPATSSQLEAFCEVFCAACQANLTETYPFGCPVLSTRGGIQGFWRVGEDGQPICRGFVCQVGLQN